MNRHDTNVPIWHCDTKALQSRLQAHIDHGTGAITSLAWSYNGRRLGYTTEGGAGFTVVDSTAGSVVRIFPVEDVSTLSFNRDGNLTSLRRLHRECAVWNVADGTLVTRFGGDQADPSLLVSSSSNLPATDLAWSPNGLWVAMVTFGSLSIRRSGHLDAEFFAAHGGFTRLAWSADSKRLAAGGHARVTVWDAATWTALNFDASGPVAISSDGRFLAAVARESTIGVWDIATQRLSHSLEGHTASLTGLWFTSEGHALVSDARDGTIRVWRAGDWSTVALLRRSATHYAPEHGTCALSQDGSHIAVVEPVDKSIILWWLDFAHLAEAQPIFPSVRYVNAKVVMVGDTGVGKTALAHALMGRSFAPTESTHGRFVWSLEESDVAATTDPTGTVAHETREVLLWDLAGQPGYRVIHRQHLDDVSVAVVLFDSRAETDPFTGVRYWAKAIDNARKSGSAITKILVASRVDRFGPSESDARIKEVRDAYGFSSDTLQTSARSGRGVTELREVIRAAIHWDALPRVSTPDLFYDLKAFVGHRKLEGTVILTRADLLRDYCRTRRNNIAESELDTCIASLAATGLVKRLNFGDLILLQPELIDHYQGWLANAARQQADGLGFVALSDARRGAFDMDRERLLKGRGEEQLLLVTTVEESLSKGLAIVQATERGDMLVFPSELRTDMPEFAGGVAKAVKFSLEGPIKAIYAALAVKLAHARSFSRHRFYRNAAVFESSNGDVSAFAMTYPNPHDDARGDVTVYFGNRVTRNAKMAFLEHVHNQLKEMAFGDSVTRERVYECSSGHDLVVDAVSWRRANGYATALCAYCGDELPIDDLSERNADVDRAVEQQLAQATAQQQKQARLAVLAERSARSEHDVFLCYNNSDQRLVQRLAALLRQEGVLPWFDQEAIGVDQFVPALERALDNVPAACIVVGRHSMGNWQRQEYYALIERFVRDRNASTKPLLLIPTILPGVRGNISLPPFLRTFARVDFRSVIGASAVVDALSVSSSLQVSESDSHDDHESVRGDPEALQRLVGLIVRARS